MNGFSPRAIERLGNAMQSFVSGPELDARDQCTGTEVCVDVANAFAHEALVFNEMHDLLVQGGFDGGQRLEQLDHCLSVLQVATGQLPDHKRMGCHLCLHQGLHQQGLALPQVIHPNGGVDQNHAVDACLGTGMSWGSVPPSCARRWALSRCTSAKSASRSS